jgi:hypothetical protein
MKDLRAFYYCVKCKGEFNTAKELWSHKEKEHSDSMHADLVNIR